MLSFCGRKSLSWHYWLSARGRRLFGFVFIFIYHILNEKGKEAFSEEVQGDENHALAIAELHRKKSWGHMPYV